MAKSIHLKCMRLGRGQTMNLTHIEGTSNFISGYWRLNEREAEALMGGWLYLHETKASPSYRGGRISDFKHEIRIEVANQDRIGLIFRPMVEAIGISWRGLNHGRAWTGGLVDATLDHETIK